MGENERGKYAVEEMGECGSGKSQVSRRSGKIHVAHLGFRV